jgi:putative ABC transport system ATP-binding protein
VRDLRALRRDKIGFVFQAPYLIPFLDVTDNVALLPMLAGVPNKEARARALELLTALDVQHRAGPCPRSFRAASSSGWPSRAGWSTGRR